MKLPVSLGKGFVEIEIPDQNLIGILESNPYPIVNDLEASVLHALREPIGTRPLTEEVRGKKKVCIVISDVTRPNCYRVLLPLLVKELSAGGGSDLCTREVASIIEQQTGWSLTCTNMPGGSGATGFMELLQRENDGYTIPGCTSTIVSLKQIGTLDVDYNDFDVIAGYNQEICSIGVNAEWAAKNNIDTLQDFIDYSKAHPGEVIISSTAVGGIWNVDTTYAAKVTGCDWNIVPNSGGGAQAVIDCAGGSVNAVGGGCFEANAQVEAGKIKMLAVMSEDRVSIYPDVPTFKECGYDVLGATTRSYLAPKGVDPAILAILEEAIMNAVGSDEFKEYCANQGSVAWNTSGAEAFATYESEVSMYQAIL